MTAIPHGPYAPVVLGLFFSAKTGLDYRKYKKGDITKAEFKKRTKKGALTTTSSMLGSAIGSVGGMIVCQIIIPLPLVGAVIGSVVGGFGGAFAASKITLRYYEKYEARVAVQKLLADKNMLHLPEESKDPSAEYQRFT